MSSSPEGVLLKWNLGVEDIKQKSEEIKASTQKVYDNVGAVLSNEVDEKNVLLQLAHNDYKDGVERNMIDFLQHVSTDKEIRSASTEADKILSEFDVEMSMREDVFKNLLSLQEKNVVTKSELKRYLDRLVKIGKRNGLHLSSDLQDEVKGIKKRISDLSIEFHKNCNEENTELLFSEDQLVGLPDDFMKSLTKTEDGSKYKVSLKYPHYFPCMKNARDASTRKALEYAFNRRCIDENTPILEELVQLRDKKAKLLSYPTHAAFVTELKMSKTTETVQTFLSELAQKMKVLGESDVKKMLELKKNECVKYGYEFDNKINYWDLRYYMNMVEKSEYSIDHEKLKEYFPMDVVTTGLLNTYQKLLSVKFEVVEGAEVWNPDVTMYSVWDVETKDLMGYFYLDLYPREGKFGHAACFGLQPGCTKEDGTRMVPVAALVTNFTKPTDGKPSLLTHDEVVTFFHEFGHGMHQICSHTDLAYFSGTRVEGDFVEAPSQMLENWCWEKEGLRQMSKHYKDGSELPDEMVEKLIKSKNANAGVFNLRQIFLGSFDFTIHTQDKACTAEIFSDLSQKILTIPQTKDTNMPAAFGHLAGGYDAGYYGYLWSEVYSMDMFYSQFKKNGIMNEEIGKSYRNNILKPGGSQDAMDMLTKFLGRPPNEEAFLKSKGLFS